jgi:hypothetical protein
VSTPRLRAAVVADIPALERLNERSGIELSVGFYTEAQAAAVAAGFRSLKLAATMPGVPRYLAAGFAIAEEFTITLPGEVIVPLTRMRGDIDER